MHNKTIRSAIYKGNKSFEVIEVPKEVPKPGEVGIDVAYCGVCGTDFHIYMGHMDHRVTIPQPIGHEMSGVISSVGPDVTDWEIGDRVVVRPLAPCGNCPACRKGFTHICHNLDFLGIETPGAMQETWIVPAYTLHRLPKKVTLEHGSLVEPIAVACHDVRMGQVQDGDSVVVIGGGPIGTLIALIARQMGAHVLVSEINQHRLNFARELGLRSVDPQENDLIEVVNSCTSGAGADVVFEVSASQAGASVMTDIVRTRGRIIVVGIFSHKPEVDLHRLFWREIQVMGVRVYEEEDFDAAISIVDKGNLPLDKLISVKRPLGDIQLIMKQIESGANIMKALVNVRE
jgi:(R,R)-butanediol dehydrogenase/meso-butanediol dehydrogenase/diacetyl reductase